MSYDYALNYILVGDTGVGKSCLLLSFLDKSFKKEHMVTVGIDFGSKIMEFGKNRYKLLLWDTAGQEAFNSVARTYYKSAVGVLLVYDISNRKSFENINKWINDIQEYSNDNVSILVIGNKSDLKERVVTSQEGEKLAKEKGYGYIETSAKLGHNIEEAFLKMTSIVHEKVIKGVIELKKSTNMRVKTNSILSLGNNDDKESTNCPC